MAPTCLAQEPVAVTTVSQVMSPRVVFTSHSPARVRSMPVTSVLRLISAPRSRAPLANACVTSTGATWPSWGWKSAPTSPSRLQSGQRSPISLGPISSKGTPMVLAVPQ